MAPTVWTRLLTLALMGGLLAPGIAAAQQPSQAQQNAIRQSCRSDFQSYCTGVTPGGRAALNCLQENMTSLSPACQTALEAIGPAPKSAQQAAPPSVTVQGGSAAPPPGSQTGPANPTYAPPPAARPAVPITRACGADFRALCHGVRPGNGNFLACLRSNEASLSTTCKQALATLRR